MEVIPKLVLCAGGDWAAFNHIKCALAVEGFSAVLARNGRELLSLGGNRTIDAAVVGPELRDMTVFEATRSIRELAPEAPLILYEEAPRRILSDLPGFVDDCVATPNLCELVSVIRQYTSITSSKDDAALADDSIHL
jgi:DNA-binding response OmpR family regulator